jgi:hypothetical protein
MTAVTEGQARGSLTSLPDLLDRATRLHEVLSAGRTATILDGSDRFPGFGRDSIAISDEQGLPLRIISFTFF